MFLSVAASSIINKNSVLSEVWPFRLELGDKLLHEHTEHLIVVDYLSDRHVNSSISINCPEDIEPRRNAFLIDTIRLAS